MTSLNSVKHNLPMHTCISLLRLF